MIVPTSEACIQQNPRRRDARQLPAATDLSRPPGSVRSHSRGPGPGRRVDVGHCRCGDRTLRRVHDPGRTRVREPRERWPAPATLPTVTERIAAPTLGGMNTIATTETTSSSVQREAIPPGRRINGHRSGRRRITAWLFGRRRGSDLLAKAASPATLGAAWSRVRRNAGVAGGDGVSCRAFEHDARNRLAGLRRDLLTGDYTPGPMRRVENRQGERRHATARHPVRHRSRRPERGRLHPRPDAGAGHVAGELRLSPRSGGRGRRRTGGRVAPREPDLG